MKSKPLFFTLLLFTSVFLQNCISDNCDDCKGIKAINSETRQWFLFGKGSKWVYRLAEDTTVIDTLTCIYIDSSGSNFTNCVTNFASAINCSQIIQVNLQHSNKEQFKNDFDSNKYSQLSILAYFPDEKEVFLTIKTNSIGVIGSGPFLVIPYNKNTNLDYYEIKDTSEILTIKNKKYDSVFYTERKFKEKNYITNIWIKKKIGILKYHIEPNKNWELIDYKIKL